MSGAEPRSAGPVARPSGAPYLLAAPFLLLAPVTTFVAHAGYPFLTPEILVCFAVIAGAGLLCGAVMAVGPAWIRVLGAAGLLSLVIDVQTGWFATHGLRKGSLLVLAIAAVGWLLRARLGQLLAMASAALWLSSFVVPAAPSWQVQGEAGASAGDLPPFVQIILDEHIGIEGIPQEFDPDGAFAARLGDTLTRRGFTVFSRAYSRYYNTGRSVPAALNFSAPGVVNPFVVDAMHEPVQMQANATAAALRERGYRLHVVQTEFIDLCRVAGEPVADECASYTLNTIAAIRALPVGVRTKAGMILGMFLQRSEIDRRIRRLTGWPAPRRVSAVSTVGAFDSIVSLLRRTRPGDAYVIHLMLPHFPYAFDAACELRSDPSQWLDASSPEAAPRQNTTDSRRARYPRYLEQVECTHRLLARMFDALGEAGVYDQSIVVLHGDHGSRIDTGPPVPPHLAEIAPRDWVDAFSTLFAAKLPGVAGAIDRRVLPLEELTAAVVREQRVPQGAAAEPPWVWVDDAKGNLERRPLPPFAHGRVGATDAE